MALIEQILAFFGNHTPIVSFLGAIIGGEETLIFLSVLAAHGFLDVWALLVFFYLGILVSDSIWYFLGKSRFFDWMLHKKFVSVTYCYWGKTLDLATKKSDLEALFITKFLYGTRIPTLIFLAKERLGLRSFVFYNAITNFIWVPIILSVGWLAGKGISFFANVSNNLVLYSFLIGIVLIVFTSLTRLLSNIIKKWLKK